jgi:hypothetical protein
MCERVSRLSSLVVAVWKHHSWALRTSKASAHTHSHGDISLLTPTLMSVAMEQFFSPTRRLEAVWEAYNGTGSFDYTEVELAVPVEDFLNYHWDWEALYAFALGDVRSKFLWITESTFIVVGDIPDIFVHDGGILCDSLLHASSTATSGQIQTLTLIKAIGSEVSTEACSVFWRAIETSKSDRIMIRGDYTLGLPAGPSLSQFLQGRPLLQSLDFRDFTFVEEHCRALATIQRTDINITLSKCAIFPQEGALDTFIEWFRHNQIVKELNKCHMESDFISALSGNKSVSKLSFKGTGFFGEERIEALTQALLTNQGIEDLDLSHFVMDVEECCLLFRSLWTHPRILFLAIWQDLGSSLTYSAEAKSTVMNAILQMLQRNTMVIRIFLPDAFDEEEVYQNSILPRLEMNQRFFAVQRQAVKRADPSIRPQLLGRALHVVRFNPDLVFRFLSENVPAFLRTEEEDRDGEEDSAIPLENDPKFVSGHKRKASS